MEAHIETQLLGLVPSRTLEPTRATQIFLEPAALLQAAAVHSRSETVTRALSQLMEILYDLHNLLLNRPMAHVNFTATLVCF